MDTALADAGPEDDDLEQPPWEGDLPPDDW
jgi:hypothetical protein